MSDLHHSSKETHGPAITDRQNSCVTVIVPTTCDKSRRHLLQNAINSILNQAEVRVDLLLVINGNSYDPELRAELEQRSDLRAVYHAEPSLPQAIACGRSQVTGEFFSFLDDDDEYLPGGIAVRVQQMRLKPNLDFVVTNGYRRPVGASDSLVVSSPESIAVDPIFALLHNGNWLASGAGLYRTSTVSKTSFLNLPKYYEWTFLAFKMTNGGMQMSFLDVPTYRINQTPASLSRTITEANLMAEVNLLKVIASATHRKDLTDLLNYKLANALENLSFYYLRKGHLPKAFINYFRSLHPRSAWKFAARTGKVILWSAVLISSLLYSLGR